ncbi:D-alanyl-D-alanine carboxypeptidase / D-alanyl-D-alanine-endopeptidase (penicillin-binding protein 4) [Flavobacteriaceae bacterium MAR_2010_188]|nr:D-alanyl-D-alanine carboxypeptidase / D-alanyl-D-alanine-endopeptidase (penicillin-binding protein 4) [Flavobacteriaceae bacterium MAR_2010_188]
MQQGFTTFILKYRILILYTLTVLLFYNCGTSRIEKKINQQISLEDYQNQFTGLLIIDAETSDTVYSINSDKYFTPASNTKIFTLYSSLQYLGDSIPAIKYKIENDTISIVGTGDPTFLHPYFQDSTLMKFVEPFNYIKIYEQNLRDEKYGPGWAWEDYDTYFSPERHSLPMYGNVLQIFGNNGINTVPGSLRDKVLTKEFNFRRDYYDNKFYFNLKTNDTLEVPIVMDLKTRTMLWDSLLNIPHQLYTGIPNGALSIKYSIPSDSLYKRMMLVSDNFLAEQLLILCSSVENNQLDTKKVRENILSENLKGLKQKPRWVDGSGLSRYNLFTPSSFVDILSRLFKANEKKRLFSIFPSGGSSGTLKNWYVDDEAYVFAKSGSVGNNYCLSGYLITKSNRTLIFSFMNNHFTRPTAQVKEGIQTILEMLRNNY